MRATNILLSLTAALLIVGAGCNNVPADTSTNTGAIALPGDSSAANVNSSADASTPATAKIDGTWKTYTNASLGYGFKWPTTGRYAPMWSASFAKDGNSSIKDGCYVTADGKSETISVEGSSFCHTSDTAKDDSSATDYYVTKKGGQYVVLTFTKNKDAAKNFSWNDYRATLAQIVSTYAITK